MSAKYEVTISKDRKPLQTLLPLAQPLALYIDPSSVCNFKCHFCFRHYAEKTGEIMRMDLFEKIVRDMKEFKEPFKRVHLMGFGEPLINPNLASFVELMKREGVADRVEITTNASLLTRDMSHQLVNAGVTKMIVSIYSLNDKDYQMVSKNKFSFSEIYKNIEYLYSIKKQCHIHLKVAEKEISEEDQKFFIEAFKDIADTLFVERVSNVWPGIKVVPDEESPSHLLGEEYGANGTERICALPFYQLMINANGKVSPCNVDYEQKVVVGDIKKKSLKEIWNGNELKKLRKDILTGEIPEESVCELCEYPRYCQTVDITPYRWELLELYKKGKLL